jgi:hypothetical protein
MPCLSTVFEYNTPDLHTQSVGAANTSLRNRFNLLKVPDWLCAIIFFKHCCVKETSLFARSAQIIDAVM